MVEYVDPKTIKQRKPEPQSQAVIAIRSQDPNSDVCDFSNEP